MQAIEGELINYVQMLLGERPALREVVLHLTDKLPLFLRSKYELHETRILGRDCIFAFEKQRAHWLNWREPSYPALAAGMTALSRLTMIEDDRRPTFALPQATFLKNLEKGLFNVCEDPDDANIRMETWSYNPHIVTTSSEMVDPLSLFLSLRDSRDERVQQQLSELIEKKVW